jgi:RimJ/RimL family protein N-acetyltransferase
MRIIESQAVDLISPFPTNQLSRVVEWMHCYKTLMLTDDGPQTDEEILQFLQASLQNVVSYGVIDKLNSLSTRHQAPIIGMITFEPATQYNGYFHVTSRRKAWGSGLIDEAGRTAIKDVFDHLPALSRVSAAVLASNSPARGIARRLGFRQEGVFPHFVRQNSLPLDVVHFGLTRERWETISSPLVEDVPVVDDVVELIAA